MTDGPSRAWQRSFGAFRWALVAIGCAAMGLLTACGGGPSLIKTPRATLDRRYVEYPPDTELKLHIEGLTAPTAMTFDSEGSLIIAESGRGDYDPRIFGFKPDGTFFELYPRSRPLPQLPLRIARLIGQEDFRIYGPIGGLTYANGRLYVSHRDGKGNGVITAFNDDGSRTTIVAGLPAQGDHAVTDLVVASGRLYFGVGSATNSGVVGLDNFHWVQDQRDFSDRPNIDVYLLGRRFTTPNPFAGIFGETDTAVTAPFQPFGQSLETRVEHPRDNKPTAAIYSVDVGGGDLRVEAHGIRNAAGLGFSESGALYFTNQGMKFRGTRPVQNDPDVMLRWVRDQWYGWPDFSANLQPIREPRFQPPPEVIRFIQRFGYRDISFLIDHASSGLTPPNPGSNLVAAEFLPLAGASKFSFAPTSGYFSRLRQAGNVAIVALWGDRAPFDTGLLRLREPTGYRVVRVNLDERGGGTENYISNYVANTRIGPASRYRDPVGLERPVDVKFGPDGAMYILDFGEMDMKGPRERVRGGTGRVFRLAPRGK